jgi:thymidine phosphorylase
VIEQPNRLPTAPVRLEVKAREAGFVRQVDSLALAEVALSLGAGRLRAADPIDHAVGLQIWVRPGERVARGDLLATVHQRQRTDALLPRVRAAFVLGERPLREKPLVLARLT